MRLKNTLLKLSLAPVLVLALLAGACADQGAPSDRMVGPQQAAFERVGVKKLRSLSLVNAAPLNVSAEFGQAGGVLQADNYFLVIPAGTLKEKATFTMDVGTDGIVSLTAFADRANGTRADIGVIGFRKKLTLAMYYGNSAEPIANEAALQIGWVQSNGSLSAVPSRVDTNQKLVYGELQHFSKYAIADPEP